MKIKSKSVFAAMALCFSISLAARSQTTVVGGQEMLPQKNIVENAINSADHTTLVSAVIAAELVETLKTKGPFTVFAPVNDAFENLPEGVLESLLQEKNKKTLQGILTYHVVAEKLDFNSMKALIKKGNGKAEIVTVAGGKLWLMMNGEHNIIIKDEKGNIANISVYDVMQSNGVIHVIDQVLLPK